MESEADDEVAIWCVTFLTPIYIFLRSMGMKEVFKIPDRGFRRMRGACIVIDGEKE